MLRIQTATLIPEWPPWHRGLHLWTLPVMGNSLPPSSGCKLLRWDGKSLIFKPHRFWSLTTNLQTRQIHLTWVKFVTLEELLYSFSCSMSQDAGVGKEREWVFCWFWILFWNTYLFTWQCWVLVMARRIFSWRMHTLADHGWNPGPPPLEAPES